MSDTPMTTARTLILFAEELATSDAISPAARDELIVAAGQTMISGDVFLSVVENV